MSDRLAGGIGGMRLRDRVICGSSEPVMTEAGIRAALRAGAAGVIAKSVVAPEPACARLAKFGLGPSSGCPGYRGRL